MRAPPNSGKIAGAGLEQVLIAPHRGNLETKRTRTYGSLDLSRRERLWPPRHARALSYACRIISLTSALLGAR
jgi:hypothetical protein